MFRKLRMLTLFLVLVLLAGLSVDGTQLRAIAQDSTEEIVFDFTVYQGNPVLPRGEKGAWDGGFTFMGYVLYEDGMFHMFYIGGEGDFNKSNLALGYASSEDGLDWTKYAGNPILPLGGDRRLFSIFSAVPVHDADMWTLYVTPHTGRAHPDSFILRATAPEPTALWEVNDTPVLEGGGVISPDSIVSTADGYVMYYWVLRSASLLAAGRATSPDGITWTQYNDPATGRLYEDSDPVLTVGESGRWDDSFITSADVWLGEHGWEMFYTAGPDRLSPWVVGYATSGDGITWTRYGDSPILTLGNDLSAWASSVVVVDGIYYLYYSPFVGSGPITGSLEHYPEICVATGTITRGEGGE